MRRLFGRNHIGQCSFEVSSSNDVKPKVSVLGEYLEITPKCKCGEELGVFSVADKSSYIIERARLDLKEADEKGRPRRIQRDASHLIPLNCSKCGREFHVSVHFVLDKQWLKKFDKRYKAGHKKLLYGNCLEVDVEIKGGYIESEKHQPLTLSDLVSPKHACCVRLNVPELYNAVEEMIKAISDYWEGGEVPKQRELKIKAKCAYCLGEATVKAALIPKLPSKSASIHGIIAKYKAWQNR